MLVPTPFELWFFSLILSCKCIDNYIIFDNRCFMYQMSASRANNRNINTIHSWWSHWCHPKRYSLFQISVVFSYTEDGRCVEEARTEGWQYLRGYIQHPCFGGLGIDSIGNSGRTMKSGVEIRTRDTRVLLK